MRKTVEEFRLKLLFLWISFQCNRNAGCNFKSFFSEVLQSQKENKKYRQKWKWNQGKINTDAALPRMCLLNLRNMSFMSLQQDVQTEITDMRVSYATLSPQNSLENNKQKPGKPYHLLRIRKSQHQLQDNRKKNCCRAERVNTENILINPKPSDFLLTKSIMTL